MLKKSIIFVFAAALALHAEMVFADPDLYVPPPAPPPAPVQTPTINHGSNVGQASQDSGSGANNAAGAALIAAGTALLPNPPTAAMGAALIAMGIIALAQGSHDSNAAGQSANTGAASIYNNGKTQQPADPYGKGNGDFSSPAAKAALQSLQDAGYNLTDKGFVKPDGSVVPMSAFQSAAALKAAGLDPNAIKKAEDIANKVAQDYKVSSVDVNNGGGGGSAHDVGGGAGLDGADGAGKKFNLFALGSDAQKALIAGKTVNLDGEPIGVAGANIFDMIHQAYQKKRSGDQFEEAEEKMARMPASVKTNKK